MTTWVLFVLCAHSVSYKPHAVHRRTRDVALATGEAEVKTVVFHITELGVKFFLCFWSSFLLRGILGDRR